ncbi:efflux RND transporter permease subunit [Pontibacter sp. G13]|uniref:efflux RND transporter permease subunit n=1 Tax=Pontibacter sp. G13 TaxID=3074898 RepID=UPI00288B0CC0|nr:efflux RND transporter permease subunit [Pontibacter sp. G13]WNJ20484.1 efflux RND transporter permease subunit [Pontibacter sp. G13]
MRLPKLAIANFQFVLVMVCMAVALGVISFLNMPRSEDPTLDFPNYTIIAVYPGASPVDLEELVADPLEEKINELEDLTEILTEIEDGVVMIQVEGSFELDIDEQFDELKAKVNEVRADLPDELYSLETIKASPLDVSILQLAMVSEDIPYAELLEWTEKLEKRIEQVNGVRTTEISGFPEEEVRIALNLEKMSKLNLPLTRVMGIIQGNNANIPGGNLKAGTGNFSLKTSGGYRTLDALRETVVAADGGNIIRLRDIAKVYMDYEDDRYLARYNGKRAMFLSVTQKGGVNILDLSDKLNAELESFAAELPATITMEKAFEQGPAVESRVNDFFGNLLQGLALVGLIILAFLGIRNALIIITVIPASVIVAIFLLDANGFGLQQISIAGLVIALGLLVDNGIVVAENINRFIQQGFSSKEAAAKGTAEVGWAIVSSTVTTILSFFPMTQLGGGTGAFIESMPLIVMFSLIASLIFALTLTPLLATKLITKREHAREQLLNKWMRGFVDRVYRPSLEFALKRPLIVMLLAVGSLGGSFALFPLVGVSFFPAADKPVLLVNIELPQGSNLDHTDLAASYVEAVLDTFEGVEGYAMNVGHGNPQIYYNIFPENYTQHYAQALVELDSWDKVNFYDRIDRLRAEFATYPGANIQVEELKNGPPAEAPIAIKVIGEDLNMLKVLSAQVEELIAAQAGVINLDNPITLPKTNIRARVNRDKAGMLGVPLQELDLAVRTAMTGNDLGTMNTPAGDKYDLVARMQYADEPSVQDFSRMYLPTMSGAQIPLRHLVRLEFENEPAQIKHFDLERTNTLTADAADGYNPTAIAENLIPALDQIDWPNGYRYKVAGDYENQQESFGDMGKMLIIALMGIFAVLILQFRSFKQPFIVLAAIPLAFSGSIVALLLSGYSFSFFAFVGFSSLAGIVVNASIILVDYANQLRQQGLGLTEALIQASTTRFIPILLTTMTTILGLLPLTITGGNLWAPLGWTIIGGMISSTVLTLLVVPILYKWLSPKVAVGTETQTHSAGDVAMG